MKSVEEEINNFRKVWFIATTSLCYCYFVSSKTPKGIYRLISILPIIYIFTILPYKLNFTFNITVTTLLLSWLGSYKLLLFSFNKGPLSTHPFSGGPLNSLPLFIAIGSLPLKLDRPRRYNYNPNLPLNLPRKAFLLTILMSFIAEYRVLLSPKTLCFAYFWILYLTLDVSIGSCTESIRYFWGIDLVLASDEPYLATSLQDFWGKRWNILVHNLLSETVYKPVWLVANVVLGEELAKAVGVMTTFVVSGLMHELLLYNMGRKKPTWMMTWHFVVHGVFMVVERKVKNAARDRWQLPRWLSTVLTLGFVMVVSYFLLYRSVNKARVDAMIFEEFKLWEQYLKDRVRKFELILVYLLS